MSATTAVSAPTARSRPAYTRIATVGLLLTTLGPLLFLVSSIAAGIGGDDLGFMIAAALIALGGAAATWWLGTVGKALGIVASLLLGAALFWTAFGLGFPASVVDFVPGVAVPLGVLMGLGGNIAAIVAKRRGSVGPTPVERRIAAGAMVLVAVAAIVSVALTWISRSIVEAPAGAVSSEMHNFEFAGAPYEVAAGESVTIAVHNADPVVHDFTIPELGIAETVLPGSDALIEVNAEPGTYTIYCTLHSDTSVDDPAEAGMAATLVSG